jgi:hypothetical protein
MNKPLFGQISCHSDSEFYDLLQMSCGELNQKN